METDILDAGHDGAIEIYQYTSPHHEPEFVFLDEAAIAEIIKVKFYFDQFTYDNLIDAMYLWEELTKQGQLPLPPQKIRAIINLLQSLRDMNKSKDD